MWNSIRRFYTDGLHAARRFLKRLRGDEEGPTWTMNSSIEDVLLQRFAGLRDMKLHDLLNHHFGETLGTSNVSVGVFVQSPEDYIVNAKFLGRIQRLDEFQLLRAVIYLPRNRIEDIHQWEENATAQIREFVGPVAATKLDSALRIAKEARKRAHQTADGVELKGVYESIYNATWGYVESGHNDLPLGMKVVGNSDGEPELWTEEEVNVSHTPYDLCDPLPRHGNLEIAVLTSQMGWPYNRFRTPRRAIQEGEEKPKVHVFDRDVYIRREVMRVWYLVKQRLDLWLGPELVEEPFPCVLVGTPGIGKSFGVGSFLLQRLLHYDSERLRNIAYFVKGEAYIFFRATNDHPRKVVFYEKEVDGLDAVKALVEEEGLGYIIYDFWKDRHQPIPADLPGAWPVIVLTSPDPNNYKDWKEPRGCEFLCINCYEEVELKAAVAWRRLSKLEESKITEAHIINLENEWQKTLGWIKKVGPLARQVLEGEKRYKGRVREINEALAEISRGDDSHYMKVLNSRVQWRQDGTTYMLAKLVRVVTENGEECRNRAVSIDIEQKLRVWANTACMRDNYLRKVFRGKEERAADEFENVGVYAFTMGNVVQTIVTHLRYLPRVGEEMDSNVSVLASGNAVGRVPTSLRQFNPETTGQDIEVGCFYRPVQGNFPVVDAFFFVTEPAVDREGRAIITTTIVLLQATVAPTHHTTREKVDKFIKAMKQLFGEWDELARNLKWELIYIQYSDSKPIEERQKCEPVGGRGDHTTELWNKINQFQVKMEGNIVKEITQDEPNAIAGGPAA
ncbi:retrotransposon hot spot (RHS) protein, putative [Trypanosoma brucei brucei TREU927]|uniref:Retrotransposon hot spot (RHS) protein, putative n=1 Tax=Trypanosoma brucei brucei (strain 927/4 GUTat10.1) TaxID=185431 RepID=Q584N0_TRYB2|nr:retrotransposon hot spot (RHS) protein, putative [Trypanosoma brucei brucei TREU927]AAQ15520.1 retrotransposon hot spot (RHS) protein, putative [Trypanosoma brucei brucei TREU927]AAX80410.1 retrotransposon hot spot (RHS) protein, putative [Trypanosoma brucei]